MNKTIINKGNHLVYGKERYVALKDFEIDFDAHISDQIHRGNITLVITEPTTKLILTNCKVYEDGKMVPIEEALKID